MPRKKRQHEYKVSNSYGVIHEQLGLPIYSEEALKSLEVPISEHPDVSFLNDIDVSQWKEYDEIITDSLWLIGSRDKTGAHTAELHGNFIPQIPHQAMLRYTKRGETVLDTFLGSGTTLIECKRLGRNGIGVELVPSLVERSNELISGEANRWNVKTAVIQGDSQRGGTVQEVKQALLECGVEKAHLLILHPPYHDIIRFSNLEADLSNAKSEDEFYDRFELVVENYSDLLETGRYIVLVIGDKYARGEWIPLGFRTMERVLKHGYKLKSIVVKNIAGNRAKRNLEHLWRRRALKGGFYIFKHEYVMFFQKS